MPFVQFTISLEERTSYIVGGPLFLRLNTKKERNDMFEICNDKTYFLFWPKRPPRTKQSKSPLQGIGFVLTRSTGR